MKRLSVACRVVSDSQGNRVAGCGAGWWADDVVKIPALHVPPPCPRCGRPLSLTGVVAVVDIRPSTPVGS